MEMEKSTHEPFKRELFAPVMKNSKGDYIAVLSDNSVDRDDEIVSRECLLKIAADGGYLAALCNHHNDVFMQVAEWTDRGITEIDGHTALIAVPRFYKSNPNAKIIQGMLDEGAQIGISIGAMVKDCDEVDGRRIYKELELLEASFVAVPSNRHGRVMAVAKSYNADNRDAAKIKSEKANNQKEDKMELTLKDIESAVEKASKELNDEFKKQLEVKDSEISKLTKELEDSEAKKEDAAKESESKLEEANKQLKEAKDNLEKQKKEALEKMKYAKGNVSGLESDEDTVKSFKEGKLPVMTIA